MKPREIVDVVRVRRPPPPYGVRRLARCYSVADVARAARRRLPEAAAGYLDGGGADEDTLHRNRAAFDALEIVPHVLRDVSRVDTSTTVLGQRIPLPIVLAPVGAPRLVHHDGELAVARAARRHGVPYVISTLATFSLERIAREAPTPLWFGLYVWGDRSVARALIERARASGYRALVLTVDTTVRSTREREAHAGLALPVPALTVRSVLEASLHPSWWWHFLTSEAIAFPHLDDDAARGHRSPPDLGQLFDGSVSWDDVTWIRDAWSGPLAVKGILRAEDARRAADAGVDAIIVSNHGGRQLDHVPASIDVLCPIVDAVGDRVEVLLDSGIRRGTDIVTALALGARAVLVGRAHLYGLAAAGEAGVAHVIDLLAHELRTAMALAGAATLADLDREMVRRRDVAPRTSATS